MSKEKRIEVGDRVTVVLGLFHPVLPSGEELAGEVCRCNLKLAVRVPPPEGSRFGPQVLYIADMLLREDKIVANLGPKPPEPQRTPEPEPPVDTSAKEAPLELDMGQATAHA